MRKYIRRYRIEAKRKDTDEPWSEWTSVNRYSRAVHHKTHVEELGHIAQIKFNDDGIEKLWEILGGDTELADEIFDADFRKEDTVIKETIAKVTELLDKLILLNEIAMEKEKEAENVENVKHLMSKKVAFTQVKESLLKGE